MPVVAQATHRVHMEVMPLFAGYLPLPDVRLFKYLPHHSAHSSQLDAGKDSGVRGAGPLTPACSLGQWDLKPQPAQGDKPSAAALALDPLRTCVLVSCAGWPELTCCCLQAVLGGWLLPMVGRGAAARWPASHLRCVLQTAG